MANQQFHWADYLLFILMLVVSSGIGIFYAFRARKKPISVDNHLTGGRKMKLIPVTFSITVSFMSAVFVLGTPAEIYSNGGVFGLYAFGYIPVYIVTAFVFVPLLNKLNLSSGYQYLERRFNNCIRVLGSATFTFLMIVYMGVVMYTPALALSQVTGFTTGQSILMMGLVCTFYTSIGGIKAVIWTDVFQMFFITAGLLALLIQGSLTAGGLGVVFDKAREGEKLPYFEMNPDPFVRHTFWTLSIGGFFTSLSIFAANQALLQRYMSLPNTKQAQIALMLNLPLAEIYLFLVCLIGFVLYAHYENDDPLAGGKITRRDQIVPYFMMETLGVIPGMPGLFVACVFSAALSTVSSGVNSLATVTIVDFIKPALDKLRSSQTSQRVFSILSIAIAFAYGFLTMGFAYLVGLLGSTVLQIALSIFGMFGGPLLGLFVNGMFFPCINHWGAAAGLFTSLSITLWLGIGGTLYRSSLKTSSSVINSVVNSTAINVTYQEVLDVMSTQAINITSTLPGIFNTTGAVTTESNEVIPSSTLSVFLSKWYSLSYLHYATVALSVSVLVGLLVSACTGFNKKRYVNPDTYYNVLSCCGRKRQFNIPEEYMLSPGKSSTTPMEVNGELLTPGNEEPSIDKL